MTPKELIGQGRTALGIEFGSTRIKGVLIDYEGNVLAVGEHVWENHLENGIWTYPLSEVDEGLRSCYSALRNDVKEKYGIVPETFGAIGVSAMMHGYIALDKDDRQLAPFQTWRNTNTTEAADELTGLFQFNIPLRWSAAHLYQRMLDGESHVTKIDRVFTLDAYVHFALTGEFVTGVGDASGMFPQKFGDYDQEMVDKFDALAGKKYKGFSLKDISFTLPSGFYISADKSKWLDYIMTTAVSGKDIISSKYLLQTALNTLNALLLILIIITLYSDSDIDTKLFCLATSVGILFLISSAEYHC